MSDSEMDNRQAEETSSQREEKEESSPAGASSRRAFIRKTAEVAALSLFGLTAIDPLVEKILRRMEEMSSMRSLARSTGDLLHEAGIGAMAFADAGCNCPGQPTPFSCLYINGYNCPQNFQCPQPAQGQLGFQCYVRSFDCTATNFVCAAPNPFYCQGGYLCPTQTQFYIGCTTPSPWDCNPNQEYNKQCINTDFLCQSADGFMCPGTALFECSQSGASGKFTCIPIFKCYTSQQYDFTCNGPSFQCGNLGVSAFNCQDLHMFDCGNDPQLGSSGFSCSGSTFTCSAGGNRCGYPGTGGYNPTGSSTDPTPGDFICLGAGSSAIFQCIPPQTSFLCNGMAGDFLCWNTNTFQCNSPFSGCVPNPNSAGRFQCDNTQGYFTCNPPANFSCGTNTFSPTGH